MIYDQPDLINAVFEKLSAIFTAYAELLGQFSCIGVIVGFDDMGFKTQTMYPPEFFNAHNIPIHKICADIAHSQGKLYFVHSCGNLMGIMDVLIDDVKMDAKHSFEDAIMPVEDVKRVYGGRTALVGGLDLDVLCRADEKTLRARVRNILRTCSLDGGYAFGSGNSLAKYVPVDNFIVMLEESRLFSHDNFG
jgi:uroporphyrinogen decarboxylase